MRTVKVEVVNNSNNDLPTYATNGAAALDLRAFLEEDLAITAHGSRVVDTGLYVAIPEGYKIRVGGRSGLAFKNSVEVHRGIIDSDYRGELKVKIYNHSDEMVTISNGDRICQAYIEEVIRIEWDNVLFLPETNSNRKGGLGSTGIK